MTLKKRLRVGVFILASAAIAATGAVAAPTQPLSAADAQHYAAAFDAAERGDYIDAQMQTADIADTSLMGYLSFQELMHPSAHKATFDELASWLGKFRDLPLADRIFSLASKRKPADGVTLPAPELAFSNPASPAATVSDRGRRARDAFYAGDARRALDLAPAAGEHWIAGLAAYRLGDFSKAQAYFEQVARDGGEDPWLRAGGAYWAYRAATAQGDIAKAQGFLRMAAQAPDTFYGMIAARQTQLRGAAAASSSLVRIYYAPPDPAVSRMIAGDARAHRAAALAQIGRAQEAGQELRAGVTLAKSEEERGNWTKLAVALGEDVLDQGAAYRQAVVADYPEPSLEPKAGFTIDKALVYAIVRQESRFNPSAVSPVGAVGLMQLMPDAAARAAGDDKLRTDMSPLFDPAMNLRVGQDYVTWLMERGVGYDLLRTVAAYNGGPGTLQKTAQMVGPEADSLLVIECLPSLETRNYVEKVVAAYWTYRRMFGQDAKTLDALAAGARMVDVRLDLADPRDGGSQLATQGLQVGMN